MLRFTHIPLVCLLARLVLFAVAAVPAAARNGQAISAEEIDRVLLTLENAERREEENRKYKGLFPQAALPDRSHRHQRSSATPTIERQQAGIWMREPIPAPRSLARFSSFADH